MKEPTQDQLLAKYKKLSQEDFDELNPEDLTDVALKAYAEEKSRRDGSGYQNDDPIDKDASEMSIENLGLKVNITNNPGRKRITFILIVMFFVYLLLVSLHMYNVISKQGDRLRAVNANVVPTMVADVYAFLLNHIYWNADEICIMRSYSKSEQDKSCYRDCDETMSWHNSRGFAHRNWTGYKLAGHYYTFRKSEEWVLQDLTYHQMYIGLWGLLCLPFIVIIFPILKRG